MFLEKKYHRLVLVLSTISICSGVGRCFSMEGPQFFKYSEFNLKHKHAMNFLEGGGGGKNKGGSTRNKGEGGSSRPLRH